MTLYDTELSCLMFADDLVLLSTSSTGLQCALDKLQDYCNKWQLIVNTSKTQVMIFNKGGHNFKKFAFTYCDRPIDIVNRYCYLGIVFSSSGSFKAATENLVERANRAIFALKQYDTRTNVQLSLKLFDSLVMPIIRYCSEVWSLFLIGGINESNFMKLCDSTCFEKLHVKFCKFVLGVGRKATNSAVKGELGRYPLLVNLLSHSAKYWLRLCSHDTSSLVHKAYLDMYDTISATKGNWAGLMKKLWHNFDMKEVWENHGSTSKNKIAKILNLKMSQRYEHNWMAQVGLSPTFNNISAAGNKLRTYTLFKNNFGFENYIIAEKNFKRRQDMSRLRISAHCLKIETGRYCRPPLSPENRVCPCCNSGDVEDELHFLLKCPIFENERHELMNSIDDVTNTTLLNETELFKVLMGLNGGDTEFVAPVLEFVHKCFEKRKELVVT